MSVTIDADILSDFLGFIAPVADEFKLVTSPDGFETRACDAAQVSMTSIEMPASTFIAGGLDEGVLGLTHNRIADVVNLAGSGDEITLDLDDETRKLSIDAGGLNFTVALIDPSSIRQEPAMPDLADRWVGDIVIEAGDLQRAIKASDLAGDHVRFSGDPEAREFVVSAQGDTDSMRRAFSDADLIAGSVDESCSALFSLDYMTGLANAFDSQAEVRVRFGDEVPVSLSAETACGDVQYLLAPRINS